MGNCNLENHKQFIVEKQIRDSLCEKNAKEALEIYRKNYRLCMFVDLGAGNGALSFKNHIIILLVSLSRNLSENQGKCNKLMKICNDFIIKLQLQEDISSIYKVGEEAIKGMVEELEKGECYCKNAIIKKLMKYIDENIQEELTLELLSKEIHLSRNYLSALFIESTGNKITKYISLARREKSKDLLKNTSYSLDHIANLCGYKNQSYFSKVFKSSENITPLQYRKKFSIE